MDAPFTRVGVRVAGAMGAGIAQIAAQSGATVHIYDVSAAALAASRERMLASILLGDPLTAEEAKAAGLIAEIIEDGEALNAGLALAARIAGRAPLAMRQGKALVQAAYETTLGAHLQLERQCFSALFGTADRSEGIAAFLGKRDAVWTGA